MKTIFLLRGVPGSGKTTMARFLTSLIGESEAACFSADDFMLNSQGVYEYDRARLPEVHDKCQRGVRAAMEAGKQAIFVHNTMTREWEMDDYFQMADSYGYRVVSLIVENRHGNKSVYNLKEEDYDRFRERFETKI